MPPANSRTVLRLIRKLAGAAQAGDPTDGQLLTCFIRDRDETAFAALVDRHGPMVLNVCRRMLSDAGEVEDVFQAVFLVLVKKARSISKPSLLGNWLYGVACRTARNARRQASRRHSRTKEIVDMPATETTSVGDWQEVRPLLDEELELLPEKYRAPLVLCYLQGKTYTEAARILGWADGTVSGRLARGRALLRARLLKRGLTLSAAALATLLLQQAAKATILPATLASNTVKAALLVAAGNSLAAGVSTHAAALTEGVLKAMFLTKLKIATAVVMTLTLAGMSGGMVTYNAWGRVTNEDKRDAPASKEKEKPEPKKEVAEKLVAPVEAAKPAPPAVEPKPLQGREILDLLAKQVTYAGMDDPKAKLSEVLEDLATIYDVTFDVNERAFEMDGLRDVLSTPVVVDGKPLPRMKSVRFSTVLNKILSRLPGESGAVYVVRRDHIEITTEAWLRSELRLHPNAALSPLVSSSFDKVPLEDAIKEISAATGFNIVLDAAKLEKSKLVVTANLYNVPVDTAVRILAEMANLRVVPLDNVLFITSKETATRLQKEQEKRKEKYDEGGPTDDGGHRPGTGRGAM
jgi:RNA polymerase sigma factor (sigma-70 family)